MKWFAYDSPVMRAISKAADLALINLLWVVCSLPLVTAGAALCAKYYVGMKIAREQEPAVIRSFFSSFSQNLRQTLLPSILFCLGGGALLWDWRYAILNESPVAYRLGLFILSALFMMVMLCFFVIIARYKITNKEAWKSALGMTAARLFRLLVAVAMFVLPFIISIWYLKWSWLICLGVHSLMLHFNSQFFVKEFDKLEKKQNETTD